MTKLNNLEERLKKIIEEKVGEITDNEEAIKNEKTAIAINEGYIRGIQVAFEICQELENERPKGKWIITRTLEHDGELCCNKCGQEHPNQKIIWNYCPNCGAKMEVE